jgi:DNA-binding NarL/FixJ family response regulator
VKNTHCALGSAGDPAASRIAFEQALGIFDGLADQLAGDLKTSFLVSPLLREVHTATRAFSRSAEGAIARRKFGGLTERVREIAALIAAGKSNRGIAVQLVVTERTAEKHVEIIMTKLGFRARTQIAAWAVEVGLKAGTD